MKKIDTFSKRMNKEIVPYMKIPKDAKKRKLLQERVFAGLMGESKPDKEGSLYRPSQRRDYIFCIFNRYVEIHESLSRLKLCIEFISNKNGPKKISELDYIKYHYEYYLNELYIFKLRTNRLFDFVVSKCRKKSLHEQEKIVAITKKAINESLESMVKIRGAHVHDRRFSSSKMDQIHALSSIADEFELMARLKENELRSLRKKIKLEISTSTEILEKFFDKTVYTMIGELIFEILPPKIKESRSTVGL